MNPLYHILIRVICIAGIVLFGKELLQNGFNYKDILVTLTIIIMSINENIFKKRK